VGRFSSTAATEQGDEMSVYQTCLIGRTKVADGTIAFQFEKPTHFDFKPGQYIDLTIPDPEDHGSSRITHTFSIASSPLSPDLLVATRMRSTLFKRTLAVLPIGIAAQIEGPMGSFHLHNNTARPAVLLAGGIGIAPFLSILSYAAHKKLNHSLFLFYANRKLKDAAFIDDLWQLERENPRFRFVPTLTRPTNPGLSWKGRTGHISSEMLFAQVGHVRDPIYYIAGPPDMVAATIQTLGNAGVEEDDIRTEEFAGY
jgi:ferredoxin-NADP reductase